MRSLSVRQLVVLQIVVDHGPLRTVEVRDHVHDRCPCLHCEGVGSVFGGAGCEHCEHGHVPFSQRDAYRALQMLERRGHVEPVTDPVTSLVFWFPQETELCFEMAGSRGLQA